MTNNKMTQDEIIIELIELLLLQEKELDKLRQTVERISQYIEVYESYIRGE